MRAELILDKNDLIFLIKHKISNFEYNQQVYFKGIKVLDILDKLDELDELDLIGIFNKLSREYYIIELFKYKSVCIEFGRLGNEVVSRSPNPPCYGCIQKVSIEEIKLINEATNNKIYSKYFKVHNDSLVYLLDAQEIWAYYDIRCLSGGAGWRYVNKQGEERFIFNVRS